MFVPNPPPKALRRGNRRAVLAWLAAAAGVGLPWARPARAAATPLRFGTTPVFLNEQIGLLERWQRYLEARLRQPVRFVQRGSYREIVDLLLNDGVEAAWLCGHPLVLYEARLALVAVPHHLGKPLYRSHLIVPKTDRTTQHVTALRGRLFAYSDPLSNSGYLVPRAEIHAAGADPARFFARSFFTFSHRKVIDAVRLGLAHGGAVDGYVWDTIAAQQPGSVDGLRVAWRSEPHGFPPVVARRNWAEAERRRLAEALLDMEHDAVGREVLQRLDLDRFGEPSPHLYDGIRALIAKLARAGL
jgi:phosphonate transport system substrate-binding protein